MLSFKRRSFQVLCVGVCVCEEIVRNAACLQKGGRVVNIWKKAEFIWDQGDLAVGGEFSHLHRFLDSTFAASFCVIY